MKSSSSEGAYRPEVDGLRAVAVVPVVLFHLGYDWIRGGFVGVDVFFVISGFLITRILVSEFEQGSFSFREFWLRRVLRIMPALFASVIATLVTAWLLLPRTDHPNVGKQALAAMLSVANIWFWRKAGDYWGPAAESSPLLHTWSLSVEEQFYLCLPLLLWLIVPRSAGSGRGIMWLGGILGLGTLASFALFILGVRTFGIEAMFYLLPSRAWELGVGCTLAAVFRSSPAEKRGGAVEVACGVLGIVGLALIASGCLLTPGRTRAIVAAVAGAALVLACGRSGPCHALLTQWPVVAVGKASYSIYLWHWPVIVFSRFAEESFAWTVAKSALLVPIAALATASYLFIEQPTRRDRRSLPFIAAGGGIALAIACGLAASNGTYDTSGFEQPTSLGHAYHLGRPSLIEVTKNTITNPVVKAPLADTYLQGGIIVGESDVPRIVVLGDSHGTMWCDAIRKVTEPLGITTSFYCAIATSPFINDPVEYPKHFTIAEKRRFDQARLEFISRWQPDIVIVCARWAVYTEQMAEPLLDFLDVHARRVLLVEQVPELNVGDRDVLQWLCYKGVRPADGVRRFLPEGNLDGYRRGLQTVRDLARAHPNCEVVPMRDIYADGSQVLVLDGRHVVYGDNDHLTDYGTSLGIGRIEAAIESAGDRQP